MLARAQMNSAVAARVKYFKYRVPFELYDYEKDPDALDNLINDPAQKELIHAYWIKLAESVRTRDDTLSTRFIKAF